MSVTNRRPHASSFRSDPLLLAATNALIDDELDDDLALGQALAYLLAAQRLRRIARLLEEAATLYINEKGSEDWTPSSSGTHNITFLGEAEDAWMKVHCERFPELHGLS